MFNKVVSSVRVYRTADTGVLNTNKVGYEVGKNISLSMFLESLYEFLGKLETDEQSKAVVARRAREFMNSIEDFQLVGEETELELDEDKMLEEEENRDNYDNYRVEERNVLDE